MDTPLRLYALSERTATIDAAAIRVLMLGMHSILKSGLDSRVKGIFCRVSSLKIGQVAALAGVAVDTVRYYERLGLLPKAQRRCSGYRAFDASAVERLKLIKQIQELGLTLEEIHGMLDAIADDSADCARESARIEAALCRTEEKLAALRNIRKKLQQALKRCRRGECDLVDQVRRVKQGNTLAAANTNRKQR